ncbi:MAG TPA: radical SAM protein [Verrucomicrobiota bacterium]|nr:radical SAM protein [Verrucomicrobiota bacterium]HRR63654.1 radical SAM protein [Candidatus Paceibacterota bacterium]HOM44277.1 radical SAM protein [Verrucomicrobiota bacterium]HOQ54707.1 radical SAM protein [Verrucomicrobiota bacterium]HPC51706.1 radical SAM protein [Verrucomicrobiota bacterium]
MRRHAFFLCYFETTRRCDQGCPHCMTDPAEPASRPELSTAEAQRLVLDELRELCPKGAVSFSGGEILQRADHLELIAHNARNGLYTFVNTSGSGLDSARMRKLKQAAAGRLTMGFSLDSVDDDIQKKCRAGDRERLERLLHLCEEQNVPAFVLLTVSRRNLASLSRTMDWLRERKIAVIRSPFVPRGAAANARHLCFDRADMGDTIHPALRANPLSYVSYTPFFAAPDATRLSFGGRGLSLGNLGCQAGRTFIGINAEGDVAPCVHLLDSPVCCGNVRDQALSRIVAESEIMRVLRGERPARGKCARCRYGDSCRGCRALAYYHTGDYLAEDPTCFFQPDSPATRSPLEETQTANTRLFLNYLAQNRPWRDIFGVHGRLGVTLLNFKAWLNTFLGSL